MNKKEFFDHPFRSDKDGLIHDLRTQIDDLAKENVRLERINRGERRRLLRKICVWTVLLSVAGTIGFGIIYGLYLAYKEDVYLGKRCTKLCNEVLGHISVFGDETMFGGCNDSFRHCQCRIISGYDVTIGPISKSELNSDLNAIAKKFDFNSWRKCVNFGSKVPDISCGRVPRKDN